MPNGKDHFSFLGAGANLCAYHIKELSKRMFEKPFILLCIIFVFVFIPIPWKKVFKGGIKMVKENKKELILFITIIVLYTVFLLFIFNSSKLPQAYYKTTWYKWLKTVMDCEMWYWGLYLSIIISTFKNIAITIKKYCYFLQEKSYPKTSLLKYIIKKEFCRNYVSLFSIVYILFLIVGFLMMLIQSRIYNFVFAIFVSLFSLFVYFIVIFILSIKHVKKIKNELKDIRLNSFSKKISIAMNIITFSSILILPILLLKEKAIDLPISFIFSYTISYLLIPFLTILLYKLCSFLYKEGKIK